MVCFFFVLEVIINIYVVYVVVVEFWLLKFMKNICIVYVLFFIVERLGLMEISFFNFLLKR